MESLAIKRLLFLWEEEQKIHFVNFFGVLKFYCLKKFMIFGLDFNLVFFGYFNLMYPNVHSW